MNFAKLYKQSKFILKLNKSLVNIMISKLNIVVSKIVEVVLKVVITKTKYGKADPDCPPSSTPADIANPLVM